MSTLQGMFNDRDIEARFAPDGCERLGPGHYRRKSQLEMVTDEVHEAMRDPMRSSYDPPILPKAQTPLETVATQLRTMPYGDLLAMAEGTKTDPGKLWNWAVGLK